MLFNTLIALLLVYAVMRARFESPVFPATIRCIATGARHLCGLLFSTWSRCWRCR